MNFLFLVFLFCLCEASVVPRIPSHLEECYRGGGPPLLAPRRLDVYISLLRKLERHTRLDMRMFSTSLLRSFRLDGIEEAANRVETENLLPWRAGGFQFHRYKILMDIFLPSQNLLEVDDMMLMSEKCLLHRMMSSSVRQWERGDEAIACPLSSNQRQNMATGSPGRIHSRCPIEEGVIQTKWGSISPGTLVAAIASSLEPQRVLVSEILDATVFRDGISEPLMAAAQQEWFDDIETFNAEEQPATPDISNIWVATLAGDLAEVVVNQGPIVGPASQRLVVGSNNRWNDTFLPRDYYLLPRNASSVDWHFTDAEILAGVDGLILANYLPAWLEQRRTLRLSQVIDMYYSHEGVSFDPRVKACNRQSLFNSIFTSSTFLAESSRFARVLSLRQIMVYLPAAEIDRITEAAVASFMSYVPNVLSQNHVDCLVSDSVPVIDMVVATDGAWARYEVEQFISWLGGALEINMQRSTLGLLHGNTGNWIVPPANNLTDVFEHMSNFTDSWPNRLNVATVISRAIGIARNKTLEEVDGRASAGPSTVVLVVSPSDRPSGTELERAADLMRALRRNFFDVYFAYIATDLTEFQNINIEYLDYSELYLTEVDGRASAGPSIVVLVVSPSDRPSGTELERAADLMRALRRNFFDVYFAYIATDLTEFQNINIEYLDYSELYLTTDSTGVTDVIRAVDTHLVKSTLPNFATRIFGPHCTFNDTSFYQNEFEDFVLPGRIVTYRIHPFYLRQQPLINVVFRNDGQGQLLACAWRGADASHACHTVPERGTHVFNLTNPCPSADFCPPAYFSVAAATTANLCAHDDCRLPHQVGYYVSHSGLRCLPLRGSAASVHTVRLELFFGLLFLFNINFIRI